MANQFVVQLKNTPGAMAVLRTLGRPRSQEDAARAATDRALIWGGIEVVSVS